MYIRTLIYGAITHKRIPICGSYGKSMFLDWENGPIAQLPRPVRDPWYNDRLPFWTAERAGKPGVSKKSRLITTKDEQLVCTYILPGGETLNSGGDGVTCTSPNIAGACRRFYRQRRLPGFQGLDSFRQGRRC